MANHLEHNSPTKLYYMLLSSIQNSEDAQTWQNTAIEGQI